MMRVLYPGIAVLFGQVAKRGMELHLIDDDVVVKCGDRSETIPRETAERACGNGDLKQIEGLLAAAVNNLSKGEQ